MSVKRASKENLDRPVPFGYYTDLGYALCNIVNKL